MKIKVEEVADRDGATYVRARSNLGSFWANWHGDAPAIGKEYRVEIELENLAGAAVATGANASSIRGGNADEPVTVIGQVVEAEDEYGVTTIMVGETVVMVEGGAGVPASAWLECRALPLDLYDTNQ